MLGDHSPTEEYSPNLVTGLVAANNAQPNTHFDESGHKLLMKENVTGQGEIMCQDCKQKVTSGASYFFCPQCNENTCDFSFS